LEQIGRGWKRSAKVETSRPLSAKLGSFICPTSSAFFGISLAVLSVPFLDHFLVRAFERIFGGYISCGSKSLRLVGASVSLLAVLGRSRERKNQGQEERRSAKAEPPFRQNR
jgi:hypothetical protein